MEDKSLYSNTQTFCRLIEIGTFSGVANKLGISQSTVSRRIALLEENLGVSLLRRNTRNFELTESGQQLYDTFIQQEAILKRTFVELRNHGEENDNPVTIRLSLPMGVINGIISPHIPDYLQRHPNLSLLAFYQNREVDMVKENFDLAILRHVPKHLTLRIRKLYQCQFNLYCTPEYIIRYGEPKSLTDLGSHLVLGAVREDNMVNTSVDVTLPNGERILWKQSSRFMLNNNDPSLRIGKSGQAIIAGIDLLYKDELLRGELVKVMPNYKFATFEYYLVRTDTGLNPHIEEFIKFIEQCFRSLE